MMKMKNDDNYVKKMKFLEKIPYICWGFCLINQLIVFINTKNTDKLLVCFYIMMVIAMYWILIQERRRTESSIKWRDDFIKQLFKSLKDDEEIIRGMPNQIRHLNEQNEFLENIVFKNNAKNVKFKKRWKI